MVSSRLYILLSQLLIGAAFLYGSPAVTAGQTNRNISDETIKLSLEDAVERTREQNWEVLKGKQRAVMAKADYKATKSLFLPSLEFSETLTSTNDPVQAFSFKLKQMRFGQDDFALDVLNNPDRLENFTTRLELEQPILNFDGMAGRESARNASLAARLMSDRIGYQMEWIIKQWYFRAGLTQARQKAVQKSLQTAQKNLHIAGDLLEEGLIKKADEMAANVRVLERKSDLKAAENDLKNVYERLKFLLNYENNIKLILTDSLAFFEISAHHIDSEPQNRTDILALESGIAVHQSKLKAQKAAFLPRINAFASYELNDDDFMGGNADNYMVGARLSWTLFKGTQNIHQVQKAKAELQEAELQYQERISESRVEINQARRNLQLARDQLKILELAVKQAEETLRIRSDRFEAGMVTTTDLLSAEALVLSQRLNHLKALYEYHLAVFRIEFLTEQQIYQP